jgi:diguanylate cyclase (GGDEF)-like protein
MIKSKTEKYINLFILSKCFELTAWGLIILRGNIPNLLSILFANYFFIIGSALEISAFLMLTESYNRSVKRVYAVLVVVYALIFNMIYFGSNVESARVMLISLYIVILWSYPIHKLLIYQGASILQRIIAILYSLALLSFAARAIAVIKLGNSMTLTAANFFNALTFLILYMVMLIGSIGFILLSKQKADHKLFMAATYDNMTGIYNRSAFIEKAAFQINFHARKERPLTFLLIDFDHFKKINDTYGHLIGDAVLKEFVQIMKLQLRSYDLFGRFGGEEFVILLPETDKKDAEEVSDRLRHIIEMQPFAIDGNKISYTISIGAVALIPDHNTTIDLMFTCADRALYRAKDNGRNKVEFCAFKEGVRD